LLNSLKATEFPWIYEVSKCAAQEALRDLDKAFKKFFNGLKQKRKIGFPRFKKKSYRDTFRLTGTIKIKDKEIQLPRLGVIKLKEKSFVEGSIFSATISREADRWYVSLAVEQDIVVQSHTKNMEVGVDVGLHHFATLSSGEKIEAPKPLAKKIARLKTLSKQLSRKVKGSNNRKKAALKLARKHRKIRNIRKDFLHKFSTMLAKTKSAIVIEDLDIKKMLQSKKKLKRSIHDAGWGELRRMLEYKTTWYGSKLIIAPRYFPSSKRCSKCGFMAEEMPLSVREWECQHCHCYHDRDINAAKNLLDFHTESSSGIYACGDHVNGGTGDWSTSCESLKQELMSGIFVHNL
jgi:putative transposase